MFRLFEKKYTIGDLMNIDSSRQERASKCNVSLDKTYHEVIKETLIDKFRRFFFDNSIINTYYVIFKLNVTSDTGGVHKVIIKVNPDFNLSDWENNKIQIYCDCQDFKFRSAYRLELHKSLFVNDKTKIALGPAIVTAPKSKKDPGSLLCKHAYAALTWLVNNYSSLMRTI